MVDVSPDLLQKCKDDLVAMSAKFNGNSQDVCKGKTVYADGKDAGKDVARNHTACHSWIGYAYNTACGIGSDWGKAYKKDARNFLVLSCHSKVRSKNVCSAEASDFLVRWMANDSPFSQFILNRDDTDSLTEGGVVLLCGPDGLNISQAYWVCKVLRFTTEGAKAAETFMTLVQGGVDPMLAVLVASHIRTIKGATFGYTGLHGHSTVFGQDYCYRTGDYTTSVDIVGLVSRSLNDKPTSTSTVFSAPKKSKVKAVIDPTAKIKGFCKPYKKDDGWGGKVEGVGADATELVKRVLAWQEELGIPTIEALIADTPPPMPDSNTVYLELDL